MREKTIKKRSHNIFIDPRIYIFKNIFIWWVGLLARVCIRNNDIALCIPFFT